MTSLEPSSPSPRITTSVRRRRHLMEPIAFEEEAMPRFVRAAIAVAVALVGLSILWAYFTRIDEVALAPGEVAPAGAVKPIEHLEGGVLSEVLVQEGELVAAGQVLVRMDPMQARSELAQMEARLAGLMVREERLKALAEGRSPDFGKVDGGYRELSLDQTQIWTNQVATQRTALEIVESQIEQRRRERTQLQGQLDIALQHLTITKAELAMREKGVAMGVVSRQVFYETQRAKVTAEGEVERLREEIRRSSDALAEVERRRANLGLSQRQDVLAEMGTVSQEIAQVRNALSRLEDRVRRLDVRAPVAGLVQDLKVRAPGEIVQPGGLLMRVVPVDEKLIAEVRISSSDVGHTRVGQPVKLKISSYDYVRYGALPGVLQRVSATTFVDPAGVPYYKGAVALSQPYLGPAPGQRPILPGMIVQADILTGNKSLLEYLLKPVAVSLSSSFHER
ncbi:HlyD family type I secretion periplasmic adaptor subunit [Azospirillum sp. SYSU D00513]|uniref:HlyD family type I secretion periplasmic adaptor subunit n=1 Tax=Azospirillum sp. SYSU D00513 TaxID=2812561 RepID=UPI001A97848C